MELARPHHLHQHRRSPPQAVQVKHPADVGEVLQVSDVFEQLLGVAGAEFMLRLGRQAELPAPNLRQAEHPRLVPGQVDTFDVRTVFGHHADVVGGVTRKLPESEPARLGIKAGGPMALARRPADGVDASDPFGRSDLPGHLAPLGLRGHGRVLADLRHPGGRGGPGGDQKHPAKPAHGSYPLPIERARGKEVASKPAEPAPMPAPALPDAVLPPCCWPPGTPAACRGLRCQSPRRSQPHAAFSPAAWRRSGPHEH